MQARDQATAAPALSFGELRGSGREDARPSRTVHLVQHTTIKMAEKAHAVNKSVFTWSDITYGVGKGAKSKEILHGISGSLGSQAPSWSAAVTCA